MADVQGFLPTDETFLAGGIRPDPRRGVILDAPGAVTYVYRTSGGSIGSTTSRAAVPAGAVILYAKPGA